MNKKTDSAEKMTATRIGKVVSTKMNKTVTVLVQRRVKHPLYGKVITRTSKLHAHDEKEACAVGDTVSVISCRPLSKTKSWMLHEILEKGVREAGA